jgi:lysyl-tRNA synthetase class 2
MKRLLAAGFGPIFQITRAFRDGERGRLHNPEFAILEWYRPGWDHHALMDEVEDLVRAVLSGVGVPPELAAEVAGRFERLTYREAFLRAAGTDPFAASERELEAAARERAGLAGPPHGDQTVAVPAPGHPERMDRDSLLNVLLAALVERTLGFGRPTFLLDYPPSQAALARVRQRGPGDPPVAERFELHVRGVELANGYHELTDPEEQERRFRAASEARRAAGKVELPLDERFLEALRSGLPACAGVALGLDRLVMLAVGAQRIDDVIAFPSERA